MILDASISGYIIEWSLLPKVMRGRLRDRRCYRAWSCDFFHCILLFEGCAWVKYGAAHVELPTMLFLATTGRFLCEVCREFISGLGAESTSTAGAAARLFKSVEFFSSQFKGAMGHRRVAGAAAEILGGAKAECFWRFAEAHPAFAATPNFPRHRRTVLSKPLE